MNEIVCNDIEDFADILAKTSMDSMKEIYVDLWTSLKKESIGKNGKDIFELLIRRANEYKKVNKENKFEQELSQHLFTEENVEENGDQAFNAPNDERNELEVLFEKPIIEIFSIIPKY